MTPAPIATRSPALPRANRGVAAAASAVAAAAAVVIAGCGSVSAPGAGAAGSGGSGAAPVAACGAPGLRVSIDPRAAGVAAGTSYVPINFTNTSSARCRMVGFPAVAFAASAAGRRIGTAAVPDHGLQARAVTLAPGATAHAWLQVLDAANYPASHCHPVTAPGVAVNLPGQASPSFLAHPFPACAAGRPGSQLLSIQPIRPGRARRGSAQ